MADRFQKIIGVIEEDNPSIDFDSMVCNFCMRTGLSHDDDCYNADRRGTLPWIRGKLKFLLGPDRPGNWPGSILKDMLKAIDEEMRREIAQRRKK